MVALHPDALKNLAEFWSSLGSKLRASLTVTATICVPIFSDVPDFIVTTHRTTYTPKTPLGTGTETIIRFGGRVVDLTAQAIPGALVDVLDAGLQDTTDSDGQFLFDSIVPGAHTIRAVAVGYKPQTQPLAVPGTPEDYVIQLSPL